MRGNPRNPWQLPAAYIDKTAVFPFDVFPFDEPTPTAFYLVLYLGTMVLHVVPMNYVLAGSGLLAVLAGWETVANRPMEAHARIAATLRDWLPLALSIAITAGVAPLLFLQVLYKEPFYTANLLLLHRWMLILPVLIVAFYLLYLQKSKRIAAGPAGVRLIVSVCILACFGFVAWAWTENHLLSLCGQETWNEQYAHGGFFYGAWEVLPRLALWCIGAVANMAILLAWQLRTSTAADDGPVVGEQLQAARPLRRLALICLPATAAAGVVYALFLPTETSTLIGERGGVYLLLAVLGLAMQAGGWAIMGRQGPFPLSDLIVTTCGALLTTTTMTLLRELRRLAEIDITLHYGTHAKAAEVGGLGLFIFFLLANSAAIVWVLVLVGRRVRRNVNHSDP